MDSDEAREALEQVSATHARMAETVGRYPLWRHAIFGALFFALIGSVSISTSVQLAAIPIQLAIIFLIVRSDRQRMGVFINGYRRGATLPLTLGMVVVSVGLVHAAMTLRQDGSGVVLKMALATLSFLIATGFSVYWQRIFQLELKAGAR